MPPLSAVGISGLQAEEDVNITTVSSREFNQDVTRAKRAAEHGPVFITDRGKPSHVLLTIEEYRRLTGKRRNIVDALSMLGLAEIKIVFPRSHEIPRPAELE